MIRQAVPESFDQLPLCLGLMVAGVLPLRSSFAGADAVMLVATLSIGWALYTYTPRCSALQDLLSPSLMAGLTALAASLVYDERAPFQTSLSLAFGVFLITSTLITAANRPGASLKSQQAANIRLLLLMTAICSSPVWLYPTITVLQWDALFRPLILWLNPLSFLSVMADYDFLRNQWFYANSPLGSERYHYPSPALLILAYGLVPFFSLRKHWSQS